MQFAGIWAYYICSNFSAASSLVGVNFQENEDDFRWRLSDEEKTLFMKGNLKEMNFSDEAPWRGKEESVQSVVLLEGVELVGIHLFTGMKELMTTGILVSLASIGTENCVTAQSYSQFLSLRAIQSSHPRWCVVRQGEDPSHLLSTCQEWSFF